MEIIELNSTLYDKLKTFKSHVWPLADKEHYGDNQPNFSKSECTLVATEGSDIIGYLTLLVDTGVAQIEPLMVKTELHGQGIGTKLLQEAESKALLLGVHKIWLETGSDWRAKDFYLKHGYTIRTTLPNHTGGREFVIMDKMIQ